MKSNTTKNIDIQQLKNKIAELEKSLFKSKQAEEVLRKTEEQLRIITDNTSDNIGITTFDLKAEYIYVNPSVKHILGYEPEDLLGKSFFNFIHPDDKKVLFPLLIKYVNQKVKKLISGKELPISETIEFRFKNKAGKWRYMQSTVNIVGKNLLAVTRDITKRKQAEEKLISRNKELETFNEITVGRELKMLELKKEINELLEKTGKKPKYKIPI